jgi:predicted porin
MQKKIIALAVAGLVSGAAFAQSNVTIYGIADASYIYSKQDSAKIGNTNVKAYDARKFSGVDSGGWSGGRVGFRGEEALGNGLKAIFTYEFGTNIDEDSRINQTRQAFVGLSSGYGSVTLGRQYAPSFMYLGATTANDITGVNPVNLALGAYFVTMQTGGGSRWNNAVAYHSPNWSGFDFRAIYGFGEKVNRTRTTDARLDDDYDGSDAGRIGLGLRYNNGPLYLTAIYQKAFDSNDVTEPSTPTTDAEYAEDGSTAWAIGGNYDFKVVKVFANYIREKRDQDAGVTGLIDTKKTLWSVGLGVPVSKAGTVHFEYMQFKGEGKASEDSSSDSGKAKGFGIGYYHDLSKRTRLYANVSRIDNDDGIAWGFGKTAPAAAEGLAFTGEVNTNFQAGIRHAF